MDNVEALEKGRLLKEALKIINELAKSELADIDGKITDDDFDVDKLQSLIIRARKITKGRWWDLT